MSRVAFTIFGFNIYYYSLFILLGVIIAYHLIIKEAKKHNIQKDIITDIIFYTLIVGIIGARIYYVIFNFGYYKDNIIEIFKIYNGGLAIHGGIISGAIFLYFYSKNRKINYLKVLDISLPCVLLAQSLGRWGNFFNKEAYGSKVELSTLKNMHIPKFIIDGMKIDGSYYLPTFLFESILCLLGFIIIMLVRKNKNIKLTFQTALYLIFYGIIRFVIEIYRTDSLMILNLKMAQIVSIIGIIIGVILLVSSKNRENYY